MNSMDHSSQSQGVSTMYRRLTFAPSVILCILRLLNLLAGELLPPEDESGEVHRMKDMDIQLWYLICVDMLQWKKLIS